MDKQLLTAILIIVGIIALYFLITSFRKSKPDTFTGSLVNANPKSGYTNAYYSIDQISSIQHYYLTFTPEGFVISRPNAPETGLPVTKEITVEAYKAFINKYPDGLALGNVLDQYQ